MSCEDKKVVIGVRKDGGRVVSTAFDESQSAFHAMTLAEGEEVLAAEELLCAYEAQRWYDRTVRRSDRWFYVPAAHLAALKSYFHATELQFQFRGYAEGSSETTKAAAQLDAYLSVDRVLEGSDEPTLAFDRDPSCFLKDGKGARVSTPGGECAIKRKFFVEGKKHVLSVSCHLKPNGPSETEAMSSVILEGERLEVAIRKEGVETANVWIDCGDGVWKHARVHKHLYSGLRLRGVPCFETKRYGEAPAAGSEVYFACGLRWTDHIPQMCLFVPSEEKAEVRGLQLAWGRKEEGPWRVNVARYLAREWLPAWPQGLRLRFDEHWLPLFRAQLRGHPRVWSMLPWDPELDAWREAHRWWGEQDAFDFLENGRGETIKFDDDPNNLFTVTRGDWDRTFKMPPGCTEVMGAYRLNESVARCIEVSYSPKLRVVNVKVEKEAFDARADDLREGRHFSVVGIRVEKHVLIRDFDVGTTPKPQIHKRLCRR